MRIDKYFLYIVLFASILYSCGGSGTSESTETAEESGLDKCDGNQAYFKYTFQGGSTQTIDLKEVGMYAEYMPEAKYSTFTASWGELTNGGSFVLNFNGSNLTSGTFDFPTGSEDEGGIMLNLDGDLISGSFVPLSGQLLIDNFEYLANNRSSNSSKDFAKGTYNGSFQNLLDYGNEGTQEVQIDFCLCGVWDLN